MKRRNLQELFCDEEMFGSLTTYELQDGRWCVEFGVWNRERDDNAFIRCHFVDQATAHRMLGMLRGGAA